MRIPGIPFHQGRNDYSDRDGMHYGIAIHNTSNTASDEAEASYADHRTDGTSSHFYVDKDSVTQSLDTNAKAGHAGSTQGNENAIAFELTGTNDKSRQWWLDNIAWGQLGYVIAYIIQHDPDFVGFQVRRASVSEMKSNPKVKAFYSHNDMRLAWGGTTHDDPGPNFPWDRLFEAVNTALGGSAPIPSSGGDPELDTTERSMLNDIHYTLTTNDQGLGAEHIRWASAMPLLQAIAAKVDVDPAELEAIKAAAREGAASASEGLVEELAARLVSGVTIAAGLTQDQVQSAVITVLRSEAGQNALVQAANTAEDH